MSPPAAVLALRQALPPTLDPAPLDQALAIGAQPWRTAVIGRQGVGKSTLINALVGSRVRPTGLGGVTRELAEVDLVDGAIVDTPGIDEEVGAMALLHPLLEAVDAVIWVVDGLQPLTATERRVVDTGLDPGTPLHVVVSKLDLADDHEEPLVLERARALTAHLRPASVRRLDLRGLVAAPPDLLAPGTSPRRVRALRGALDLLQARLDALPPAADRASTLRGVRAAWTEAVRRAEKVVDGRLSDGVVADRAEALEHLRAVSMEARERFLRALDPRLTTRGLPELPLSERPAPATTLTLPALAVGRAGDAERRAIKAAAARWLAEGELALVDWLDGVEGLDDEARERARCRDALTAARAAIGAAA